MAKMINFNDLSKGIYTDIDESNEQLLDISPKRLNFIEKEKEELQLKLKSKYKTVNKIDCVSYDCFWGYIQEIILTSHSSLFTKMLESIIDYQINRCKKATSYNYIKLYNNYEPIDKVKIYCAPLI